MNTNENAREKMVLVAAGNDVDCRHGGFWTINEKRIQCKTCGGVWESQPQPPAQKAQPGNCIHDIPLGMDCFKCMELHPQPEPAKQNICDECGMPIFGVEVRADVKILHQYCWGKPPTTEPAKGEWRVVDFLKMHPTDHAPFTDPFWCVQINTGQKAIFLSFYAASEQEAQAIAAQIVEAVKDRKG